MQRTLPDSSTRLPAGFARRQASIFPIGLASIQGAAPPARFAGRAHLQAQVQCMLLKCSKAAGNDALDRWVSCPRLAPARQLARQVAWVGLAGAHGAGC